jgi:hypothetical protein
MNQIDNGNNYSSTAILENNSKGILKGIFGRFANSKAVSA